MQARKFWVEERKISTISSPIRRGMGVAYFVSKGLGDQELDVGPSG